MGKKTRPPRRAAGSHFTRKAAYGSAEETNTLLFTSFDFGLRLRREL